MSQKKTKYYAVRSGHKPGVYQSWEDCRDQVDGYSKAEYKAFPNLRDAEAYLGIAPSKPAPIEKPPVSRNGSSRKHVVIYADGACTGNPGPGGYGVVMNFSDRRKELSAGFRLTTNNRMEILGCIAGLQALKEPCDVTVYSDSKYVVNTMSKSWAVKWRQNGWKRREGGVFKEALNQDLWMLMLELCDKHKVEFQWVRGHDGNELNERCDELARAAAASHNLGVDAAYEK